VVHWSIRKKLHVLLLVVFLPAVAVIVATGLNQRRSEIEGARSSALLMVKSLTAQQEQIASATETMLTLLAQLPAVRNLDAQECNRLFADIQRRFPNYSVILAVTPNGDVFAASMPFKPGTINLADRKHVQDAIRTREFSVGEYVVGRISHLKSLNYTYPVFDGKGKLAAVVIAGFNLDEYTRYITKAHPADGVAVAITDWKGVRLFRMPETPTTSPGKPLAPDLVQFLWASGQQYGSYERLSQDGVPRIYAYSQLRLREGSPPYLYMLVGIPRDPILRKANLRLLENLLTLGLAAVLAVVAAWIFVGRMLVNPLNRLVTATRLFGKGAMNVRTGVPHTPDELGELAQSFDDTIALLEARDAERQKAEQALHVASAETELFLTCIPSVLIGLDSSGRITRWNAAAANTFGIDAAQAIGQTLDGCGVQWLHLDLRSEVTQWLTRASFFAPPDLGFKKGEETRFVSLGVQPIARSSGASGLIVTGAEITQRKYLEEQLRQAQKLEAVGQLAAGIAHEINTPAQFVGDNIVFLKESWASIAELVRIPLRIRKEVGGGSLPAGIAEALDRTCQQTDIDFLLAEVPSAIDQARHGIERISKIVRAMKEFSHPGGKEKSFVDINHAIGTTITVARNEWKYVADMVTEFDPSLMPVSCMAGEFNQVMLNLIVNAAQAIGAREAGTKGGKGTITISTTRLPDAVRIAVRDTGTGIPENVRARVFEPFFTTKPVGKGTGQGLALAHTVIVQMHQGQIWFESEVGVGTTFFVQLPATANPQV
jgi:signal transduction histidine kinase